MTEQFEQEPRTPEQIVPSPATEAAWRTRGYLLQLHDSVPGSRQAEMAEQAAKREFAEMVELTHDFVYGNIYKRTNRDREATPEIYQEVYLRAYKGLKNFRGDSQVETWLYKISSSQLSNYYKKESRRSNDISIYEAVVGTEDSLEIADTLAEQALDYSPEAQAEAALLGEELLEMIDGLPPQHRRILHLRSRGFTHKEAAQRMGVSETAAKVQLHRIRKKLLERLQSSGESPES